MNILSKLIRKIFRVKKCPLFRKCLFYKCEVVRGIGNFEDRRDHFCHQNFEKCARYYLINFATCDCVDKLLQPEDMEKAKLIEQIERRHFKK